MFCDVTTQTSKEKLTLTNKELTTWCEGRLGQQECSENVRATARVVYTEWNYGTFEWFSESSFIWSFPVRYEVLDISQIAKAFHRTRPPSLIQS